MDTGPTDTAKGVAHALFDRFGAAARVGVFTDETSGRSVDIAFFPDCPRAGVTTISTIGLCDHDLGPAAEGLRVEIIAAFPSAATDFPNALGSCALAVMTRGWPLQRGAVHTDILDIYGLSSTLAHILFMMPSLWDEAKTAPIAASGRTIAWLMAVPIAETEREYAARNDALALEALLAKAGIDMLDLDRPSAAKGLGGYATVN